ncbi:MAG: FadR family transcriptional regulator [Lachnospiraceae bacterium]|nr:FadR family transcriptional regulator [Lachnospiraceae bacterium]
MKTTDKASDKVIEYVETLVLAGKLKVDDRLPAERELAQFLNVSRTAVREGIRLLEVIGIVESRQGSGNYISRNFDETLEQVLTMMYALDEMGYDEIREFRYAVERQALVLAVHNADENGKKELKKCLDGILNGATEAVQIESDRMLHYTLVRMSRNRLVIANYVALDRVINRFIRDVRKKIRDQGSEEFKEFQDVHRELVQAVLDGNLEMGKQALDKHFVYLRNDYDT